MKIALASDHAGYSLKEYLKSYLEKKFKVIDFGTSANTKADYPVITITAAQSVAAQECDMGIIICGTGIGSSIAANKVKGIRAALCHSTDFAVLSKKHNNANVLVLPGRFIAGCYAQEIVQVWLETQFEGGRHENRINQIKEYENRGLI